MTVKFLCLLKLEPNKNFENKVEHSQDKYHPKSQKYDNKLTDSKEKVKKNNLMDYSEEKKVHTIPIQSPLNFYPKNLIEEDEDHSFIQREKYINMSTLFTFENFYKPNHHENLKFTQQRMVQGKKTGKYSFSEQIFCNFSNEISNYNWENYVEFFQNWENELDPSDSQHPLYNIDPFQLALSRKLVLDSLPPPYLSQWGDENNKFYKDF